MTEELAGLERIAEPFRIPIRQYAGLVREIAQDSAEALTLFGAIVTGSFDPKWHAVKSVLMMDAVDLAVLRRLAAHGVKLGRAHISAPLIMTPRYVQTSLDTFPLEFIEIQQQHLTLWGEDRFSDLTFDDALVRLQCERELKALLIGLRQGLLAATGQEKLVAVLETNVGEALMRTFRGLAWLKGCKKFAPAADVVAQIEEIAGRKLPGVRNALDAKADHGWRDFDSLYADVEAHGEVADAW